MDAFVVETGIPMPPGRTPDRAPAMNALRALAKAPAGSSVLITGMPHNQISGRACSVGLKGRFAARKVDGGIRVWVLAEPVA